MNTRTLMNIFYRRTPWKSNLTQVKTYLQWDAGYDTTPRRITDAVATWIDGGGTVKGGDLGAAFTAAVSNLGAVCPTFSPPSAPERGLLHLVSTVLIQNVDGGAEDTNGTAAGQIAAFRAAVAAAAAPAYGGDANNDSLATLLEWATANQIS